jgi:hypothetical protein
VLLHAAICYTERLFKLQGSKKPACNPPGKAMQLRQLVKQLPPLHAHRCGAAALVGLGIKFFRQKPGNQASKLLTHLGAGRTMRGSHRGGVPKRSTGADCKSAGSAFAGSNPAPSTSFLVDRCRWYSDVDGTDLTGGCSGLEGQGAASCTRLTGCLISVLRSF